MSTSFMDRLAGGEPLVWLDFYDYAGARLAGASGVPWLDDAAFAAFHGKAQGLLGSDVITVPVARIAEALLRANPALSAAMGEKKRPAYPLRRLLEDAGLRQAVSALLGPLRAADSERPVALVLPSPRQWLAAAYAVAHGEPMAADVANDPDEIDGAAVYVANFLGEFASAGVDLVLLCESADNGARNADDLSLYDSVFKTCRHFRWAIGLLDPAGLLPVNDANAIDLRIAPAGGRELNVAPAFWQADGETSAPPAARLYHASIPADAVPETVLDRLAVLRRRDRQAELAEVSA
ncbi:hypothetical protein O4G98_01595 [Zoogloeaceae bacterium G21618-S1]|nr:hypothetical protein [Zoogloeaceae bacterium G21618-S1]